MFQNFDDATDKLIEVLPKMDNNWLIVSISKNGEKIAKRISESLNVATKRVLIESVSCQKNRDCEMAMITEFENILVDETLQSFFDIEKDILIEEIKIVYEHKLLKEKINTFYIPENISNILIVDEKIETGLRMDIAIETIQYLGCDNIFIAIPLIPESMFLIFEKSVNKIFFYKKDEFYTEIKDYFLEK